MDKPEVLGASLRDRATLASPQAPTGLGHSESVPSAELGPETARLADRLEAKGTVNFRVSWGPGAAAMTAEERASALNAVMDEIDHPLTGMAGRLEGEAWLKRDTIMCTRERKLVTKDGFVPMPPSKEEESLLRSLESAAETMEWAGRRLREIAAQGTSASGQDAKRLEGEAPQARSEGCAQ